MAKSVFAVLRAPANPSRLQAIAPNPFTEGSGIVVPSVIVAMVTGCLERCRPSAPQAAPARQLATWLRPAELVSLA